jgi:hypothetical protein
MPRPRREFRIWHVVCLGILSCGCIYPFPWHSAEENVAPTIVATSDPSGATVVIGPTGKTFFVVAQDPEHDPITFGWYLSEGGPVLTATPVDNWGDAEGSAVAMVNDPTLDGQTLTCIFWDSGSGERANVAWTLEVE